MNNADIGPITETTFTKALFWDVNPMELDWEKNKVQIVERVISRGMVKDWKVIKKVYGIDGIASIAKTIRSLDARTLNFVSTVTRTPIEKFRCYIERQSTPTLWNSKWS